MPPGEEALGLNDDSGDLAGGYQTALIADRHGEGEPATLDLLEGRLGCH
jgi:hypothetical protein